ncbi:MAG: PEP-CTERM sorting domain-containing protein [Planctomycetia bacterium]
MKLVRGCFLLAALVAVFAITFGGVASAGLIAHYEFNNLNATDNLVDSSGNGHTLVQLGGANGTVVFDSSLGSNVLSNPNDSRYLMSVGTTSLDLPVASSITLAGWFKQTGLDPQYTSSSDELYRYAMSLGTNGSEPLCSLGFLNDGTIVSYVETDYGDAVGNGNLDQITIKSASPAIAIDTNGAFDEWHHVALVLNRATDKVSMYLDGVELSTTVLDQESPVATHYDGDISHLSDTYGFSFDTGTPDDKQGAVAGYHNDDDRDWIGYMDDVRFYDSALTATEVGALVSVPEPSTIVLLVCGALGLLFFRRK